MNATLVPLHDSGGWIHGYFGLENASIQGRLVFHSKKPVHIDRIQIRLLGRSAIDYMHRDTLVNEWHSMYLLYDKIDIPVSNHASHLDLPFAFDLPPDLDYDQEISDSIISPGLLLPPPICLNGIDKHGYPWSVNIQYQVEAKIIIPGKIFKNWTTDNTYSCEINPLLVYDPRLIPHLLHPEVRRWRSAPASIIEYDVEVGNTVLGPNDFLNFGYRLQVPFDSRKKGIRIKQIDFVLIQTIILGRIVYKHIAEIGSEDIHLVDRHIFKTMKSSKDVLKWEEIQYVPLESDGNYELREISSRSFPNLGQSADKYSLSSNVMRPVLYFFNTLQGTLGGGGDGIYVEGYSQLQIPSLGEISPSTFKYNLRDSQVLMLWPKNHSYRTDPLLEILHLIRITVELYGADKLILESPVIVSCVGKKECENILDECPDIVPALDYERAMGSDIWVPEYQEHDGRL